MEQKDIFSLIDKFEQSKLTKLVIKDGEFTIKMENQPSVTCVAPAAVPMTAPATQTVATEYTDIADKRSEEQTTDANLIPIKAPLVGVFYAASAPDAPAYVNLGDKVEKGQVVCLVEAMKMMNELKSPADGIIKSIKAINGELVEFDQILFEVEPC